jgi:hypothetical protein
MASVLVRNSALSRRAAAAAFTLLLVPFIFESSLMAVADTLALQRVALRAAGLQSEVALDVVRKLVNKVGFVEQGFFELMRDALLDAAASSVPLTPEDAPAPSGEMLQKAALRVALRSDLEGAPEAVRKLVEADFFKGALHEALLVLPEGAYIAREVRIAQLTCLARDRLSQIFPGIRFDAGMIALGEGVTSDGKPNRDWVIFFYMTKIVGDRHDSLGTVGIVIGPDGKTGEWKQAFYKRDTVRMFFPDGWPEEIR